MRRSAISETSFPRTSSWWACEARDVKIRQTLRALAIAALAASALAAPTFAYAQEEKCSSCEAEERDRLLRRNQQAVQRAQREITQLTRQLATATTELD